MNRAAFVLTALALTAVALPASAEKTAVSEIPALPAPHDLTSPPKDYGVAGLSFVKHTRTDGSTYTESTADTKRGYCFISRDMGLQMSDDDYSTTLDEIWRFTEKDDTATLERTRFEVVTYLDNAWTKSKNAVTLRAVAKENGVAVWAMKDSNGDLVFLASHADGGREGWDTPNAPSDSAMLTMAHSTCSFGATRIPTSAVAHGGAVAQLMGTLPKTADREAQRYIIDISAAKFSRDPEPAITVRVRISST